MNLTLLSADKLVDGPPLHIVLWTCVHIIIYSIGYFETGLGMDIADLACVSLAGVSSDAL